MNLIIGGAYQGKTDYAKKTYNFSDCSIVNGNEIDLDSLDKSEEIRCIKNFHLLIKNSCAKGEKGIEMAEKILRKFPDILIISDEVGCGIIPFDRSDRIWREEVGRACCYLAENAETVVRIIGGLPTIIKGARL